MVEAQSIISPYRSRLLNWNISLLILLSMILLVIPLSQTFLLTYQSPLGNFRRIPDRQTTLTVS